MYYGLPAAKMMPVAFGEVSDRGYGPYLGESPVFNLAEYSAGQYNPYPSGMGNFFDDLKKITDKIGTIADTASGVASGKTQVVTVPTSTVNAAKSALGYLPYVIGGGVLLYFVTRKRSRR